MKRDAIILVVATIILSILAYNGRPMEKADLTTIQAMNAVSIAAETETEVVAEGKMIEATETATETDGFKIYSSIWDKVQMTFYKDGTCAFELPEYEVVELCTWAYTDGVLTVVRADGKVFTSYLDEDRATLKLDYQALVNAELIGQFDSLDYKAFFEAEE